MLLLDEPSGYCLLGVLRLAVGSLIDASLFHVALISGERYLAMKHPFAYSTIVTEVRLLLASAVVWLLSVTLQILLFVDKTVLVRLNNAFVGLSLAFIIFCHVAVYCESRRHEQQLAAQQVSREAREHVQKNKKVFKLTSVILVAVVVCYIPMVIFTIVVSKYGSEMSLEKVYIFFASITSIVLLNSFINPIIYSIRLRQFRVALIELICRSVNIAEAEGIEMRVFGTPKAVVRREEALAHEGTDDQNVEQADVA